MLFSELCKLYLADKRDGRKAVRASTGGLLITVQSDTPTVRAQLFTDATSNIYTRRRYPEGWDSWHKAPLTVLS